jgi:hypothetical protein|tara:strand:+ start:9867 stop:11633 length:1767 start_codon:yes stop_codon:yes gene_type:complete
VAQKPIGYYGKFTPTGVDQSAGRRFEALAGLAGQVGDIAFKIGAKKAQERGEGEGLTAGQTAAKSQDAARIEGKKLESDFAKIKTPTEEQLVEFEENKEALASSTLAPNKRDGFLSALSIQDQAYNRAMEGAYLASMQIDVQNNINRIAAEHPNNPQAFNSAVNASVGPPLAALVDPITRAKAEQVIDVARSHQSRQIEANVITKQRSDADEILVQSILQANDLLVNSAKDNNALGVVTATQIITERLENRLELGTISQTQFDEGVRRVGIVAQSSAYQGEIRGMANEGQWIQGYSLIDGLASEKLEGYTPQEQSALITKLRGDLAERAVIEDRVEAEQASDLANARLVNTQKLFDGIMDGEVNGADLQSSARNIGLGGISIAQYNQLTALLKRRGDATDDSGVVIAITDLIRTDPAAAQKLIIDNMGINLSSATVRSLYTTATANLLNDSPLNTGEAKRFREYLKDMIAPVSGYQLPGANEDAQRFAMVAIAYDARVSLGENPAVVAKDLVDVSVMMETDKDLDFQIEVVEQRYEKIEAPTAGETNSFNKEFDELTDKKEMLRTLREFEADLERALEGNPEAFKKGA